MLTALLDLDVGLRCERHTLRSGQRREQCILFRFGEASVPIGQRLSRRDSGLTVCLLGGDGLHRNVKLVFADVGVGVRSRDGYAHRDRFTLRVLDVKRVITLPTVAAAIKGGRVHLRNGQFKIAALDLDDLPRRFDIGVRDRWPECGQLGFAVCG